MDLLSIVRTLWRHKRLTLPVVLLTVLGAVWVYLRFSAPVYEATDNYVLVFPPAAPSRADLAANPALATANPDNPYLRFNDPQVIVTVLTSKLATSSERLTLVQQGADRGYTVDPGFPAPLVVVKAVGPTPEEALKTGDIVGRALQDTLTTVQREQGVTDFYMIKALRVTSTPPALRLTSLIRSEAAVGGLGLFLLFGAVAVGDAIDKSRADRGAVKSTSRPGNYPLPTAGIRPVAKDPQLPQLGSEGRRQFYGPATSDYGIAGYENVVTGEARNHRYLPEMALEGSLLESRDRTEIERAARGNGSVYGHAALEEGINPESPAASDEPNGWESRPAARLQDSENGSEGESEDLRNTGADFDSGTATGPADSAEENRQLNGSSRKGRHRWKS